MLAQFLWDGNRKRNTDFCHERQHIHSLGLSKRQRILVFFLTLNIHGFFATSYLADWSSLPGVSLVLVPSHGENRLERGVQIHG
jgi:hypothetical protein